MAIRIDAKKHIDQRTGERVYKVMRISALSHDELPDVYLKGYPAAWSVDNNTGLVLSGVIDGLYIGQTYNATYFEWFMKNVRLAGERLHRLNAIDDVQYNF